jgi:hypothetical protein
MFVLLMGFQLEALFIISFDYRSQYGCCFRDFCLTEITIKHRKKWTAIRTSLIETAVTEYTSIHA